MKIVLGIKGMMCPMCESHVNKVINDHFDVKKVTSNRKKDQTVIVTHENISDEEIKSVIKETGYELVSIEREE